MRVHTIEQRTLWISFEEAERQTVAVTMLAPNLFRLECTPLTELDLYFGDTIEVEAEADGSYRFLRVRECAPFRHYSWMVSPEFIQTIHGRNFLAAVESAGGTWEIVMGGCVVVHIPNMSSFDPAAELDRGISAANGHSD